VVTQTNRKRWTTGTGHSWCDTHPKRFRLRGGSCKILPQLAAGSIEVAQLSSNSCQALLRVGHSACELFGLGSRCLQGLVQILPYRRQRLHKAKKLRDLCMLSAQQLPLACMNVLQRINDSRQRCICDSRQPTCRLTKV
jgi:hypothetical protein